MEIYFDNAATTRIDDKVLEFMDKVQREHYGNPSAMHLMGVDAEHYLKAATDIFCRILKCEKDEIIYTSGGTESNNLALIGAALANKRRGMHIITTEIEHGSVGNPIKYLEESGFSVSYVKTDENGVIDAGSLKEIIREDTIMVSVMSVNNEVGSIQPVKEIGEIIKSVNKDILFHVDHVQGFTKIKLIPKDCGIDLLSVSSHKFYGPKGVGALYVKKGTKIMPLMLGGGQQRGMRSGTVNVPGIAAMALAADMGMKEMEERNALFTSIKEAIVNDLKDMEGITFNGGKGTVPNILSITVDGVGAEVMLHALEDKRIYVSSGSACSSHSKKRSGTLAAMGLDDKALRSTIRLSFGKHNSIEQAGIFTETVKDLVPVLRKYQRK